LAATCRENEKRIFESGLRVDALLLLGGLGGPFSRTEQKPCIKHGCMSYFQRQCQPTERHPQPEKSTARSATIPRVGDPYPSETVSGSREMSACPEQRNLSTNAYIPGALTESTDLQRIRLESISLS
jgi:hypothetical protein